MTNLQCMRVFEKVATDCEIDYGVDDTTFYKAAFLAATLLAGVEAHAQVAGTQPFSVSVKATPAFQYAKVQSRPKPKQQIAQ